MWIWGLMATVRGTVIIHIITDVLRDFVGEKIQVLWRRRVRVQRCVIRISNKSTEILKELFPESLGPWRETLLFLHSPSVKQGFSISPRAQKNKKQKGMVSVLTSGERPRLEFQGY